MDREELLRYGDSKFVLGRNIGRKEERERQAANNQQALRDEREAGRNEERERQAREKRRKEWYQTLIISTVGLTVVLLKTIEIFMAQVIR